jgi:hypothetical protein
MMDHYAYGALDRANRKARRRWYGLHRPGAVEQGQEALARLLR